MLLTILLVLIVLAVALPMFGVPTDNNLMRLAGLVLVIILILWLVGALRGGAVL